MLLHETDQEPRFRLRPEVPADVAHALRSSRGYFFRTPLLLPLGAKLLLSIDLASGDTVDVHVVVVGRAARPKQAGLFVRPVLGHIGLEELDARCGIAPSRMPVDVESHFASDAEGHDELAALRESGQGLFPCDTCLAAGQSVRILISHPHGTLGLAEGVVHHPVLVDGRRAYVVRRVGHVDSAVEANALPASQLLPS